MPPPSARERVVVTVAAIVVTTVALNWLTSIYKPAVPVVIALSILALALLFLSESSQSAVSLFHIARARLGSMNYSLLVFSLSSFLVGCALASLGAIPYLRENTLETPLEVPSGPGRVWYRLEGGRWISSVFVVDAPFYRVVALFEIIAVSVVGILGVVALLRGTVVWKVLLFGLVAISGVRLVAQFVSSGFSSYIFALTAWFILYCIPIGVIIVLPYCWRFLQAGFGSMRTFLRI